MTGLLHLFAAGLAALVFGGVASAQQADLAALEDALRDTLAEARAEFDFPGATAAVVLPGGDVVSVAVGEADPANGVAMRPDHRLLGGSIGKTLVAAAAIDLVHDGLLALDAPLADVLGGADWYDALPNADAITLRHALVHETGIPMDYFETEPIREAIRRSVDGPDLSEQGVGHVDLLRPLGGLEPAFPAGEGWRYSDANYALIALAAEAVTGEPIEAIVRTRLLEPLGLDRIAPQRRELEGLAVPHLREPRFRAMFPGVPETAGELGRLAYDPQLEWGGGGWAFDAASLARWGDAWFGGSALGEPYEALFETALSAHVPEDAGYGYGPGLQVRDDPALGRLRFHGGYMLGYIAKVEHVASRDLTVAVMINEIELGYEAIHARLRDAALDALGEGAPAAPATP
ncbi:hypothetical protein DDZ18_09000 [Marinicauda salina]|uniref:Beta-lactamase-related domain-containing protein n=1 Tax=Marinicauda salina TaxID=2135793 RepID=A0A2U2BUX7_9PROT|nr:serine hydrolase domain-containing protein [Marinicauda salina]PWE17780.1 hypothetical protein DDZ18_09000 [Marinicauda salina]